MGFLSIWSLFCSPASRTFLGTQKALNIILLKRPPKRLLVFKWKYLPVGLTSGGSLLSPATWLFPLGHGFLQKGLPQPQLRVVEMRAHALFFPHLIPRDRKLVLTEYAQVLHSSGLLADVMGHVIRSGKWTCSSRVGSLLLWGAQQLRDLPHLFLYPGQLFGGHG